MLWTLPSSASRSDCHNTLKITLGAPTGSGTLETPLRPATTRSEPQAPNATGATETKSKSRWRIGPRRPARPGAEDWLADVATASGATTCDSEGAGAGTEPPTRRSGADGTTAANRAATNDARTAWAGLRRTSPPGLKTASPAKRNLPAPHAP
ncbi:hypothetical protein NDU88_002613 [Pleurodeles waltl]|uniref:Uncharacterized protein n=1 Tax=Pleurodeles waltl TaxID=8319 RepID=A0AAV7LGC9_PLEWA|nr:hypothetical protein NDU88_002613 [Pleurodeles waltl]